jgi:hypothetical protein
MGVNLLSLVFMAQRVPEQYLSEQLALVKLSAQIRNFPWAKA